MRYGTDFKGKGLQTLLLRDKDFRWTARLLSGLFEALLLRAKGNAVSKHVTIGSPVAEKGHWVLHLPERPPMSQRALHQLR